MIHKIEKHRKSFVIIDKRPLEDRRLSWKAKGLLAYFLALPDDWIVVTSDLLNRSKDGKIALQSAMRELQLYGHATLETVRDDKGRIRGHEWHIHEEPKKTVVVNIRQVLPKQQNEA